MIVAANRPCLRSACYNPVHFMVETAMDRDAVKARVRELIQERAPTIVQSFTIWSLSIQTLPISVFTGTGVGIIGRSDGTLT